MGLFGQSLQVAHSVIAGARFEHIVEGQRGEGGVPAGAPAIDGQPVRVGVSAARQETGGIYAVLHIHDAPSAVEPAAVVGAVAGAAAVIHVDHSYPPAGPELDSQVQSRRSRSGGTAVGLHQQRRSLPFRGRKVLVVGRIVEGVGRPALPGGKLHRLRDGDVSGVYGQAGATAQDLGLSRGRVPLHQAHGFRGRPGNKHNPPVSGL